MRTPPIRSRAPIVIVAAVVPLLLCAALTTLRGSLENTNAALLLVLVVVAAASIGSRSAGLVAAMSSAAGFDFFLTAPYESFEIHGRENLETAVLLVLIGVAVTEIALWGRRQQARAGEQRGYLDGLLQTTGTLAGTASAQTVVEAVAQQLEDVLDLDSAVFVHQWAADTPQLRRDGSVVRAERVLDVDRNGLPTDTEIVLPVGVDRQAAGAFRLVAATRTARPSRQQRQVAVLLADEVATALRQETSSR